MKGKAYLVVAKNYQKRGDLNSSKKYIFDALTFIETACKKIQNGNTTNKYYLLVSILGDLSEVHEAQGKFEAAQRSLRENCYRRIAFNLRSFETI